MAKHAFKFSKDFHHKVRYKVREAFHNLSINRFNQEPQYTSAVLGRLHGIEVYSDEGEYLKIEATDLDDRGPHSAEKRYGADFVITASVTDGKIKIIKAILFQAKMGSVSELKPTALSNLRDQIRKMQHVSPHPKIAGIVPNNGYTIFEVASGRRLLNENKVPTIPFDAYFNQRVITTLDGITDKDRVDALQYSDLKKLDVLVKKTEFQG